MRLVEIRELEGPNPYLPFPAIRIEVSVEASEVPGDWRERLGAVASALGTTASAIPEGTTGRDLVAAWLTWGIAVAAARAGLEAPTTTTTHGDADDSVSVSFSWSRRRLALAMAGAAVRILGAVAPVDVDETDLDVPADPEEALDRVAEARRRPITEDDAPELMMVGESEPRVIAITGTNGKTTTTRLVAHLLTEAGRSVGWTSTSGVYVRGEAEVTGDWSGPAGARRLLKRDDLDWAVLETARGGILRRGLAFDRAQVTAMINISADHLGDSGILSTETLAQVKATVVRATRSDGWAVLNADDPLVLRQRRDVNANVCLTSQVPAAPAVSSHLATGGRCVMVVDGRVVLHDNRTENDVVALAEVPMTFGGAARHMVENVLVATAIGVCAGLTLEEIRGGLRSFRGDAKHNPGRLNRYDAGGATIIADYAHNEVGLAELINLSRGLIGEDGRLWLVLGTAGDRSDDTFRTLGRMAVEAGGTVLATDTPHYLRGREPGEMMALIGEGVAAAGGELWAAEADPVDALRRVATGLRAGDVVAVMAVDDPVKMADFLDEWSRADRSPGAA